MNICRKFTIRIFGCANPSNEKFLEMFQVADELKIKTSIPCYYELWFVFIGKWTKIVNYWSRRGSWIIVFWLVFTSRTDAKVSCMMHSVHTCTCKNAVGIFEVIRLKNLFAGYTDSSNPDNGPPHTAAEDSEETR